MDISKIGVPIGASLVWISTLCNMTCKYIRTFFLPSALHSCSIPVFRNPLPLLPGGYPAGITHYYIRHRVLGTVKAHGLKLYLLG
jgi:hypothetical protein